MPRQLSDEEYNFLQGRRQVADFVESIYNDPSLGKEARALIKRKYPNIQIADYDLETRVEERLDAERREREEAEERKRKDEEDKKFQALRAQTQKDYGFTDEAMGKLEQLMVERNIGDYEAAAMLMASKQPKPADSSHDTHFWNHERQDSFQEVAKDPEGWARSELMKAMSRDRERERGGR